MSLTRRPLSARRARRGPPASDPRRDPLRRDRPRRGLPRGSARAGPRSPATWRRSARRRIVGDCIEEHLRARFGLASGVEEGLPTPQPLSARGRSRPVSATTALALRPERELHELPGGVLLVRRLRDAVGVRVQDPRRSARAAAAGATSQSKSLIVRNVEASTRREESSMARPPLAKRVSSSSASTSVLRRDHTVHPAAARTAAASRQALSGRSRVIRVGASSRRRFRRRSTRRTARSRMIRWVFFTPSPRG